MNREDLFADLPPHLKRQLRMLLPDRGVQKVRVLLALDDPLNALTSSYIGLRLGDMIETVMATDVPCLKFEFDVGYRRSGEPMVVDDPPTTAFGKYQRFRFDMKDGEDYVIDRYDQIWVFAAGPGSDDADDTRIFAPSNLPASDSELAILTRWMNENQGGLFGTGDHGLLGASTCCRIPRLRTMRRWTHADGVPPRDGFERIDTLRPSRPEHEPEASNQRWLHTHHQSDWAPKPIVVKYNLPPWPFFGPGRPHPILCHPTLGAIDVLPDHAHEGLCFDTDEVVTDNVFDFDGQGSKPEYPPARGGGARPLPEVIAHGSTLASPPYLFEKGPQPGRFQLPMVSVYDGHRAGVGRVMTDSTFHHWTGVNTGGLRDDDRDKVSRYYVNTAMWLSPPKILQQCFLTSVLLSHLSGEGVQEYGKRVPRRQLGQVARQSLARVFGKCWISERIRWDLQERRRLLLKLGTRWKNRRLSTLGLERIEEEYLGAMVQATLPLVKEVRKSEFSKDQPHANLTSDNLSELFDEPTELAVRETLQQARVEAQGEVSLLTELIQD